MGEAVGILEVYGLVCAFMAADAGAKAANVRLEYFDKNKPDGAEGLDIPLLVAVKFRGSIDDVKEAMAAGIAKAKDMSGVVQSHIIPSPESGIEKFLEISGLDS